MSLVTFPRQFLVDANGSPRVGARAYFYQAGTTTEITTYTTPAYAVAHANPVLSLASGLFPTVYVNPSVNSTYKMVITDSDDVAIYTEDNIPALGFTQSDVGSSLNPQTTAEESADVDPPSKFYERGHILRYIPTAQHAAIYAGTSTYDASDAAQDWLDSLQPGDTATLVGVVRAQGLVLTTSDITFAGAGWLKPVSNSSAASVLTIGSDSPSTLVRRIKGAIKIGDPVGGVTTWSNISGLTLLQCVEADLGLDFRGLNVGWDGTPSASAVAYNTFRMGLCLNCKTGILMNPSSSGYVNENLFIGGRFTLSSGQYEHGCISVDIKNPTANTPNNNRFVGPSFEGNAQYLNIAGSDNVVEMARFEPGLSGTAGTDYAETLIEVTGTRNSIGFSYNSDLTSGNHSINHGAGTRVDNQGFTIAGVDLTDYFYPGAWARVTVSGTAYIVPIVGASFSTDTSVIVGSPVITDDPTAVVTPRIKNSGTLNSLKVANLPIPSISAMKGMSQQDMLLFLSRCAMYITARGGDYPALTLGPGGSSNDYALRVTDFDDVRAYIRSNGALQCQNFGMAGATPAGKQSAITAPTGGSTIDTESRAAVNSIITVLETFGLVTAN